MLLKTNYLLLLDLLLFAIGLIVCNSTANFTSSPESVDGILTTCPGNFISFTCTHNNTGGGGFTRWELPGRPTSSQCVVVHDGSGVPDCDPFTITMLSDNSGPTVSSTAQITLTDRMLDGVSVSCRAGGTAQSPLVGPVNISISTIPTPSVTAVEQINQTTVNVMMSVDSTECAAIYRVMYTQNGEQMVSGPSSTLVVDGLDLCRDMYEFTGNVITAGNIAGNMSSPFSFAANLSEVNGVSNVRNISERTVIKWDQISNDDYPMCISNYSVRWEAGISFETMNTNVTNVQLNGTGFPFCETTSVTVIPTTPMGLLNGRESTANVSLIAPDFDNPTISVVSITMPTVRRIVLTGAVQDISTIVNPTRMVGYNRVGMSCTPDTLFTGNSFEVTLPDNVASGEMFRVCVLLTFGDCSELVYTECQIPPRNTTLGNERVDGTSFTFTVSLPITEDLPDQLQVIISVSPLHNGPIIRDFPSMCNRQFPETLSNLMPDTDYTYNVSIARRSDDTVVDSVTSDFTIEPLPTEPLTTDPPPTTIPPPMIVISSDQQGSNTSYTYTVTFTLPTTLTSYSPSEFIIISTLTPNDTAPITDDYPLSSTQYSVTFSALRVGVAYSYSIRIVLRGNSNVDVFTPFEGSFTLSTPFSTDSTVALSVVLTFVLTLVVGVSIGVLSVLVVNKCRRSERVTLQTETEMITPPAIYEEPDVKPDPQTQGNVAYGEVHY